YSPAVARTPPTGWRSSPPGGVDSATGAVARGPSTNHFNVPRVAGRSGVAGFRARRQQGDAGVGDRLLAGRGAIVVGGSRGVGRAVARLLAALGAGVVVNGRDADAVWEVACDIVRAGDSAIGFAGSPAD